MKRRREEDGESGKKKAGKRLQVFKTEYSQRYPVLTASMRGVHFAHCSVCKSDFSVSSSGIYDCATHVNGKRHKQLAAETAKQQCMDTFVGKPSLSDIEHHTLSAELMFSRFIVEHNLPIAVADHATKLFGQMFPDSDIAKKFKCGHAKTTALICMQSADRSRGIADDIGSQPFTVCTDGSNDQSDKFYPVIVRYVDPQGSVKSGLLHVPTVDEPSCTGENIFNTVTEKLREHGLSWENCLALGADNANVMSGKKNGVIGHIRRVSEHTFFAGCPCHLMHLAAKYAANPLPCQITDRLVDIYYYLKHSAKRQCELSDIKMIMECVTLLS